jgi:hypothetical protein
MSKAKNLTINDLPLFATDEQIGEAVLGWDRRKEFSGRAQLHERDGMPKVSPVWGGRYVPAVKYYFDRDYGLVAGSPLRQASFVPDGNERWPRGNGKVEVRAPDGTTWLEDAKPTDPKRWQKKVEPEPAGPPKIKKRKLTPRIPPPSE